MDFFSKKPEAQSNGAAAPLDSAKAQSLAATTAEVVGKHGRGGARPGAGRKPGSSNVAKPVAGKPEPDQAPPSETDLEFIKTIATNALEIIDRVETNIILGTINSIGDKFISERADAFLAQRAIGDADKEIVKNACASLALKYPGISRYAPEVALIGWGASHGMAFSHVLKSLRMAGIESKKMRGAANAGGSPPNENTDPR